MCTNFRENPFSGSGDILMFICDRQTNRQTNRRTLDYHIRMGETFYLIEKITSPANGANERSEICVVSSLENQSKSGSTEKAIFWNWFSLFYIHKLK